jgi:predicted metal-dependent hydrolase
MNLNRIPLSGGIEDVTDYIVLHEPCHLETKGHSHHYWVVQRYLPNYQEKVD